MRVIVAGGAGFLGSHVTEALLREGHSVLVIDNMSTGRVKNLQSVLDCSRLTLKTESILQNIDDYCYRYRPDAIVHCALQPSAVVAKSHPAFDILTTGVGLANMVRIAKNAKVKRFILAGSIAAMQDQESALAASQQFAERFLLSSELSASIVRLAHVYGPRQIPLCENRVIARAFAYTTRGKPKFTVNGYGTSKRDFVYVKDVANAFVRLMYENNAIVEIGSGNSSEVCKAIEFICAETRFNFDRINFVEGADAGEIQDMAAVNIPKWWRAKTNLDDGIHRTAEYWLKESE